MSLWLILNEPFIGWRNETFFFKNFDRHQFKIVSKEKLKKHSDIHLHLREKNVSRKKKLFQSNIIVYSFLFDILNYDLNSCKRLQFISADNVRSKKIHQLQIEWFPFKKKHWIDWDSIEKKITKQTDRFDLLPKNYKKKLIQETQRFITFLV